MLGFMTIRKVAICVLISPLLALIVLFALPWWNNKYSFVAQAEYAHWSFWNYPQNYTGKLLYYRKDFTVRAEENLVDGKEDGFQIVYDNCGNIKSREEFKNGLPWNGICHFWKDKNWVAEYKDGKVYNGAMNDYNASNGGQVMVYYLNGKIVDKDEYCDSHKVPRSTNCFGLSFMK